MSASEAIRVVPATLAADLFSVSAGVAALTRRGKIRNRLTLRQGANAPIKERRSLMRS